MQAVPVRLQAINGHIYAGGFESEHFLVHVLAHSQTQCIVLMCICINYDFYESNVFVASIVVVYCCLPT